MALTKATLIDLNSNELALDLDGDTTLHSSTDDQIDIKIAGADDFTFTANAFNALAGSHITLVDNSQLKVGADTDLQIYHDGTNSYIANKTGALKIATETSGIAITIGHTTSEVTIADNVTVTGNINVGGTLTFVDGSIAIADLDIDGGTDIGAAIVDADLFIVDDGAGGTNRKTAASRLLTYAMAGTLSEAAQTNITSLGTLTALTVDDVAVDAKSITMTGSSSDTAVITAGTNGTLSIVTTDAAAAAANIQITADGTFEVDATTITLDSAGDIILDADGGDVFVKDAGTTFGSLTNTSGNLIIKSGTTTAATFSGANVTFAGTVGSGAITSTGIVTGTGFTAGEAIITEAELELLDNLTAGTAIASKVVTTDANIDTTGQRNLTISGEIDAATGDFSGAVDIAGALTTAAITATGIVTVVDDISISGPTPTITLTDTDDNSDCLVYQAAGNLYLEADKNEEASNSFIRLAVDDLDLVHVYNGSTVFNESSRDQDFRVETNGQTHAIFAEGGTDRVGILTSSPQKVLDVTGDAKVSTDLTVGDDLFMLSDSAAIHFGADSEITLTHVHDAGLILGGTTPTLTVGDGGAEDAKIIFDGNAQNFHIGLDDSGDKLTIGLGNTLGTTPGFTMDENTNVVFPDNQVTIQTTGTGDHLTLVSTNAGAGVAPNIVYYRNSSSPANDDYLGEITFRGRNNNSQDVDYGRINAQLKDVTDGSEDAQIIFNVKTAGSEHEVLRYGQGATVFNEASVDQDFRVESNSYAHCLFVDGGNDRVGVGEDSDIGGLFRVSLGDSGVTGVDATGQGIVIEDNANAGLTIATPNNATGGILFADPDDNDVAYILYDHANNKLVVGANGGEKLKITSGGFAKFSTTGAYKVAQQFHEFTNSSGSQQILYCRHLDSSDPYGLEVRFDAAAPDDNTHWAFNFSDTGAARFRVESDGDVQNHDNAYGSISDERIKQDIVDANSQWNDIKAVKVRNYKKKDDVRQYGDNAWSQIGVIAQELEAVSPKLVKHGDPSPSDILSSSAFGTLYADGDDIPEGKAIGDVKTIAEQVKSVNYSILYMKAIKALQEAQTRIETLETKVQALEDA